MNRAFAWLAAAGLGLTACGGQAEVARGPAPTKMAWGDSPPEPAAEEPEAAPEAAAEQPEPEESGARPGEIDLDAPVPKAAPAPKAKAEPARAKPEPAPRAKPEPPPEPEEEEAEEQEEVAAAPTPPPPSASADPLALELQKRREAAKARTAAKARATGKEKKPAATKKRAAATPAPAEEPEAPKYTGSDPCRATSFSVDRVRAACASGGRAAAKRVMKDAIGKATATGQSLRCTNCHTNQRDYALKPDAVTDLTRWLEGSGS